MFIKNGSFKSYRHIISYVPVYITQQPLSGLKVIGGDHVFTVNVKGSEPLTYQWYKDTWPITGQTSNTLIKNNIQPSDFGKYFCVINNTYPLNIDRLLKTDTVLLSALYPPVISTQPLSVTAQQSSDVSFTVSATDIGNINYQWYKDGSTINSTTSSYFIYRVDKTLHDGFYYVTISNAVTSVTSNIVRLSVFI